MWVIFHISGHRELSEHCGILFSLLMKQTGSRQDHQVPADETLLQWHQPRDRSRKGQYPSLCSIERSVTCRGSERYIHEAQAWYFGTKNRSVTRNLRAQVTRLGVLPFMVSSSTATDRHQFYSYSMYIISSAGCISMGLNR